MKNNHNQGFTLVEVLIVVVIMAVLAAVVIPQFSSTTDDARKSTIEFNLSPTSPVNLGRTLFSRVARTESSLHFSLVYFG